MASVAKLLKTAEKYGVKVVDCGNGHFQLEGRLLVNYYPTSKYQTAYVAGTVGGHRGVDEFRAVMMALKTPILAPGKEKAKRKNGTRLIRWKLWQLGYRHCYVCKCAFNSFDETTLEHIIPLDRGGLDHPNNRTLSHEPCNRLRANNMPELEGAQTPVNVLPRMDVLVQAAPPSKGMAGLLGLPPMGNPPAEGDPPW